MTDDRPVVEPAEQSFSLEISNRASGEMGSATSSRFARLIVGGILEGAGLLMSWLDVGVHHRSGEISGVVKEKEDPDQ
jgi:hypothetical protein